MPRTTRVYAPGVAYHVCAVTQGRERWFETDVAKRIGEDIDVAGGAAGHRILARVVMPNHFHIIIKHGCEPLAWMMQRVMQRAAWQIKLRNNLEGHVFQARYWAEPVPTPIYLRRAIVYTHLNPCKAGLCLKPEDYEWSSHGKYMSLSQGKAADDSGFLDGLIMFAENCMEPAAALENYLRFVNFCQERRRLHTPGDWLLPGTPWFADVPTATLGDQLWVKTFSQFNGDAKPPLRKINARDLAVKLLKQIDAGLELDVLRFAWRKSSLTEPRRTLVCGMLAGGCKPSQISRLLNISPSYVSRIRQQMRLGELST
ncbi:MAG TPA: transposase [Longimicrobiales bacterium]|nr:transposase [Longimicrobiales bacterium]